MAIEKTPLDLWKPQSATELVKFGATAISHNAQRTQELFGGILPRLQTVEAAAFASGAIPLIEDPDDPGFYIFSGGTP